MNKYTIDIGHFRQRPHATFELVEGRKYKFTIVGDNYNYQINGYTGTVTLVAPKSKEELDNILRLYEAECVESCEAVDDLLYN